jgi:preprotein translocase subunit SecE
MARLQRKKPVSKKKKTVKNDTDSVSAVDRSVQSEKLAKLTDFSKNKKPQPMASRKSLPKSQPAGKIQGYIEKTTQFFREVKIELKKVTWPSRNQTIGSTIVVILLVMIISLFLGMVDIGLSNLVRVVLH